jgi:hypothetical protein
MDRPILKRISPVRALALLLFALAAPACRLTPAATPLSLRTVAPPFSLPSTAGVLDSRAALAQGPLVLVFYRGHW